MRFQRSSKRIEGESQPLKPGWVSGLRFLTKNNISTDRFRSFISSYLASCCVIIMMSCMLPLYHPFTAVVAGPTSCRKTAWVLRFFNNVREKIEPVPSKIWYYYGQHQPVFNNYLWVVVPLFLQIDIIGATLEGKREFIRSVLCSIVCNNCAQCSAHTYEQT